MVTCLNDIVSSSAEASGASITRKVCKRKTKHPWSSNLKLMVKIIKEKLWQWKQAEKDPNSLFIEDIDC